MSAFARCQGDFGGNEESGGISLLQQTSAAAYDADNEVASFTNSAHAGESVASYGYDSTGELIGAAPAAGQTANASNSLFNTYDANGNPTNLNGPGTPAGTAAAGAATLTVTDLGGGPGGSGDTTLAYAVNYADSHAGQLRDRFRPQPLRPGADDRARRPVGADVRRGRDDRGPGRRLADHRLQPEWCGVYRCLRRDVGPRRRNDRRREDQRDRQRRHAERNVLHVLGLGQGQA